MPERIRKIVIIGGGGAGFLSAVTLKRMDRQLDVTVVHSSSIPVIGVGESTTALLPVFLHDMLGLDRRQFYNAVRPSWKLGIRFERWSKPDRTHFYYPFDARPDGRREDLHLEDSYFCLCDPQDATLYSALMERGLSPCLMRHGRYILDEQFGYHLHNPRFLAFLESKAQQLGCHLIDGEVVDVRRDASGTIAAVQLEDGPSLDAHLFVDCSGFKSLLLGKALGEKYVSYADSLFCDRAVVGWFPRAGTVLPYTTAKAMSDGWCWRIEFDDEVSCGYVHASQFCSTDEAMRAIKQEYPALGDDLRVIQFPSGRYENFWVGNVVAIGNASGFVEPLEATALHMVVKQLTLLGQALTACDFCPRPQMQRLQNAHLRQKWDDVRDFLAIHYKFNESLDTEYWRHCRQHVRLAGAEDVVSFYREVGPTFLLATILSAESIFGNGGYATLLIGQGVETEWSGTLSDNDWRRWEAWRERNRSEAGAALAMRDALERVNSPQWTWPKQHV